MIDLLAVVPLSKVCIYNTLCCYNEAMTIILAKHRVCKIELNYKKIVIKL